MFPSRAFESNCKLECSSNFSSVSISWWPTEVEGVKTGEIFSNHSEAKVKYLARVLSQFCLRSVKVSCRLFFVPHVHIPRQECYSFRSLIENEYPLKNFAQIPTTVVWQRTISLKFHLIESSNWVFSFAVVLMWRKKLHFAVKATLKLIEKVRIARKK